MMIAGLAFVATLAFEIPFAKLEGMLISGKYIFIAYMSVNLKIFRFSYDTFWLLKQ